MNRNNLKFIVGCIVFVLSVAALVGWLSSLSEATDSTDTTTSSATPEPSPNSETNLPQPITLSVELKSNIKKVLDVYYASPSERKNTPESVKSLVTSDFADILVHQWDGLMPGTKVAVKKLEFRGAAVIDGERRVSVTTVINTTYIDKSTTTEQWLASLTLTDNNKVSNLEDYPDEGSIP